MGGSAGALVESHLKPLDGHDDEQEDDGAPEFGFPDGGQAEECEQVAGEHQVGAVVAGVAGNPD